MKIARRASARVGTTRPAATAVRRLGTAGALAALAGVGAAALAQAPDAVEQAPPSRGPALALAVSVERLVEREAQDGSPGVVLERAAARFSAGDELLYTVSFENVGDAPASQVRVTQPLPPGVRYVPGTAVGPGASPSYSADGGRTFAPPQELTVPAGDGSRRPAEPADYTHLRWRLPGTVAPGSRGFLRFRAVVEEP